jgi:Glycosyl hydrolase family 9
MRIFADNEYANLRLSTYSSFHAGFFVTLKGVSDELVTKSRCLARSQMGYVVGDTGRSFVVGYGKDFPQKVHHRDSACTMEEDNKGLCDRCVAFEPPVVALGAAIGGAAACLVGVQSTAFILSAVSYVGMLRVPAVQLINRCQHPDTVTCCTHDAVPSTGSHCGAGRTAMTGPTCSWWTGPIHTTSTGP